MDANYWIEKLGLAPHPEGGYFRETYRAAERIAADALPPRFAGDRSFSTAIYFLLTSDRFSAFHRIQQDELWHFHAGDPLTIHVIDGDGELTVVEMGADAERGQVWQAVVPAQSVFAAEVRAPGAFALVGCTVAPGFEFDDFEMPPRADLLAHYPQHADLVTRLTRS